MSRAPRAVPTQNIRPGAGAGRWAFLREFLRSPRELGTAFPCSPVVATAMLRGVDTSEWKAVAELGPGTGALSEELFAGIPATCRFIAIERSAGLAAEFQKRLPRLQLVEGDAGDIQHICRAQGIEQLDAVFSALPLRLLPSEVQDAVLDGAAAMLTSGGVFAQVTYWPRALSPGRDMRGRIAARIGPMESDRLVAGNTPPAWVFRCVKAQAQCPEQKAGAG